MESITIRRLKISDKPICNKIFNLNCIYEKWEISEWKKLSAALDNIDNFFVAIMNRELVGFSGYDKLNINDAYYGLFWCQVHPDFRNKGVGRLLTERRISAIKEDRNAEAIISSTNRPWHLERFGFISVSEINEYNLMILKLK